MARLAAHREVLQNPEVDVAVPRVRLAEPLGVLPAVRAEVAVLGDEGVERVPLLLRRGVAAAAARAGIELDLALAPRNVDQVVPALAVAVHVAGVEERIAVAPRAREAVPLGDLHEHPDVRLEARRPRPAARGRSNDAVPLPELG